MHESMGKKPTVIPKSNYFALFRLPPEATIRDLESFCARAVRKLHPDTKEVALKFTTADFEKAVQIYNEVKALAKDPEALQKYRSQFTARENGAESETVERNNLHNEGDEKIGNLKIRAVRERGLMSSGKHQYMVVDPRTNEVMGSRSFNRLRLVGYSLVGTYSAGMGQRDVLVDPHTGESYGSSFQKIFSRHDTLFGESYNVTRIVDPVSGAVSAHIVDLKA